MQINPLAFDAGEYAARKERLLGALAEQRLDALLVFQQESLYYLYGYDQIGYWVYQTAIVPADGSDPTVLCRNADEHLVRDTPHLQDVRTWLDDSPRDPGTITVEILRERGLLRAGARIGVERRTYSLMPYWYDMLTAAMPDGVELVDASDLVSALRQIKSPAELELMRRAGAIMDAGFEAAFDAIAVGAREHDLHAAAAAAMYRAGGEAAAVAPPIASGHRTLSQTHVGPSDRVLRDGDPITIELGGVHRRYHAVGAHSCVVGEPTAAMCRLHDGIVSALTGAFGLIEPGRPTSEVAARVQEGLEAAGLDRRGRHVGYGTGIGYPPSWLEPLRLKGSDGHALEAGMTFFYFVGVTDRENGFCFYVGEPVAVTETGAERLSRLPMELVRR
ncbi:Xaa-Pro dipeptidase [Conexibacter arvalis]|uniref:Xaa-Pro dipeptidase n=2 Tax=Conexibacter arvalis TaxID=912552 RepID=A0A840I6U6_9ACTN|nr:Xaa-Pro peptidase family protein [Conexibacter arvalis]MBB4660577.1 Xaa-Pro dipeptidase [Conexibacter arvalis]